MSVGPDGASWGHYPSPVGGPGQGGWAAPGAVWPAQQGWPGNWEQGGATMVSTLPQQPAHGGWPPVVPGPNQPNRKPLIITLSILAAVVLVVIVVVSVVSFSDDDSGSGGDVVKGYLAALARGDAAAALSYSADQPGSKDLLSQEILKQQVARWPITNVRILDDDSAHSFGFGRVHVTAKFGDNESDVTLSVKKTGKKWKLEHAAIKVDTLGSGIENAALRTLTFFGKSVGSSPAYVFPGFIDVASSNPNIDVKLKKPFLLDALASSGTAYFNDAEFTLSDAGLSDTMSAVTAALANCARSNQLRPPNCPQHVFDFDVVDGTVAWSAPDTTPIRVQVFDQFHLDALLSGEVNFPWTAQTRNGGTKSGVSKAYVSAKADVSKSPPVVAMR